MVIVFVDHIYGWLESDKTEDFNFTDLLLISLPSKPLETKASLVESGLLVSENNTLFGANMTFLEDHVLSAKNTSV